MCEEPCSSTPLPQSELPLHSSSSNKNVTDTSDESENNSMSDEEVEDEEISNEEYNSQFEIAKDSIVNNNRDFFCESPNSEITIQNLIDN